MPEVELDRAFLHRSCVQVSSALADDAAVSAEILYTLRFISEHAREYPGEITRALVWRVVDTDDVEVQDRLGAWTLLNAVLAKCADSKHLLSRTAIAEKISYFLPCLIFYRWYSQHTASSTRNACAESTSALLSSYGKVVPAAVLTSDGLCVADMQEAREIQSKYRAFLATWKTVWRSDVYQRLKSAVRQTESDGNTLLPKDRPYLDIPATFRDSLRRLRRRDPRPSIAFHVLYCYGGVPPASDAAAGGEAAATWGPDGNHEGQQISNNDHARRLAVVPTSMTEIDKLDPAAHPRVRQWLRKLVEAGGGCRMCDAWQHTEARCPCELPFIKTPMTGGNAHALHRRRRTEWTSMTYPEAVEKLFLYGIRLPLSLEKVLDRIVSLINEKMPYEDLIEAFDTVRGAVTGPLERHAMWLHAGYKLMPSRTVFEKPSDDALSPSMEKAEKYFKVNRRYREWDQLLQSVEVLDIQYRRAELPRPLLQNIKEIQDTTSFFFCLIDGSLSAEYTPAAYARVPVDVQQLRPVKDVLCPICLEPFHVAARCSRGTEPWDLSVARVVLEENNILHMRYPEDIYMLDCALRNIDEDQRKEKEFRKNELRLAVKLVHEARVPYCKQCNIMGHSVRRCEETARRTLQRHHIKVLDMRLNPHLVQLKIRQLREAGDEREERMLIEAWELLGKGHVYPESFFSAIRELEDAQIPLAAARYSTDAVQGFLLSIKSNDLLQHLLPLRDERFPEVCLFCDSYHHTSELCDRAHAEEQGFLSELRRYGLTLWQYLRAPKRYDEQFPTDHLKGRETVVGLVRQFEEDYSVGGIARVRFLETNGLDAAAVGGGVTSTADGNNTHSGAPSRVGSQNSLYGGLSFSQLILRAADTPTAHRPGENGTAAAGEFGDRSVQHGGKRGRGEGDDDDANDDGGREEGRAQRLRLEGSVGEEP